MIEDVSRMMLPTSQRAKSMHVVKIEEHTMCCAFYNIDFLQSIIRVIIHFETKFFIVLLQKGEYYFIV